MTDYNDNIDNVYETCILKISKYCNDYTENRYDMYISIIYISHFIRLKYILSNKNGTSNGNWIISPVSFVLWCPLWFDELEVNVMGVAYININKIPTVACIVLSWLLSVTLGRRKCTW